VRPTKNKIPFFSLITKLFFAERQKERRGREIFRGSLSGRAVTEHLLRGDFRFAPRGWMKGVYPDSHREAPIVYLWWRLQEDYLLKFFPLF